jgi:hypothetical protein
MTSYIFKLPQPVQDFFSVNRDARAMRNQLTSEHWDLLELMELILQVRRNFSVSMITQLHQQQPHNVQSRLATDNTPMLASIIPVFELFMQAWKSMKADPVLRTQNISHFIDAGLQIAQKYYQKLRKNHTYIIAMCACYVGLFSSSFHSLPTSHQPVHPL